MKGALKINKYLLTGIAALIIVAGYFLISNSLNDEVSPQEKVSSIRPLTSQDLSNMTSEIKIINELYDNKTLTDKNSVFYNLGTQELGAGIFLALPYTNGANAITLLLVGDRPISAFIIKNEEKFYSYNLSSSSEVLSKKEFIYDSCYSINNYQIIIKCRYEPGSAMYIINEWNETVNLDIKELIYIQNKP